MFSYIFSDKTEQVDIPGYVTKTKISAILPLLWDEHCVECAMPYCYKTCPMFIDRRDGRCRRFVYGIQYFKGEGEARSGATVSYKKWGKLEAGIRTNTLVKLDTMRILEKKSFKYSRNLEFFSRLLHWNWHRPSRVFEVILDEKYFARFAYRHSVNQLPSGLLAVVYNHENNNVRVQVEIYGKKIYYHDVLNLNPGWNEQLLRLSLPDTKDKCNIRLFLESDVTAKLTFQQLDIVRTVADDKLIPAPKVKCVAWDLDYTLWSGVIGDDGPENIHVNTDALKIIKRLDEMGVLQTIVSKNEYDIAWNKLKELGISNYFLYPAINWGRKSQSLLNIAKELNINVDTFAVIDDSIFERNEISSSLPQVRVYDVTEIETLLSKPEFEIPITEESKHRRESYLKESQRKKILASWSGDYTSFLKDCMIQLQLFVPTEAEEQKRCFELIQRSNQYNVTKDRRTEKYIDEIVRKEQYKVFAFKVSDKFGSYGIVGFSSFEILNGDFHMRDFVMSCRVAQKAIERAFLSYVSSLLEEGKSICVTIEKTEKNNPVRSEMMKMPFMVEVDSDKYLQLRFTKSLNNNIDNSVVEVIG